MHQNESNNSKESRIYEEQELIYEWFKKWGELSLLIIDVTGTDEPPYSPPAPTLEEEMRYQRLRFWFLEHQEEFVKLWRECENDPTVDATDLEDAPLAEKYIDNIFLFFYEPENLYRLAQQLGLQSGIDLWEPSENEARKVRPLLVGITIELMEVGHRIYENSCD